MTNKPLIGLIITASSTAGTTETIGPTFGMKVSNAAMIPSVPASGTPRAHNPTVTIVPTAIIENIWDMSHQRRTLAALPMHASNIARLFVGINRRIPERYI